jgi:hypothetical protein
MRLAILFVALSSASCACWSADHAQDPKCVAVRDVVDCTKDAALSAIVPMFADLLAGANADWNSVESQITQRLTQMGFKDGGCLLASLEAEFMAKAPQQSVSGAKATQTAKQVDSVHSLMTSWRQQHGAENVRFKVVTSNGQEVLR